MALRKIFITFIVISLNLVFQSAIAVPLLLGNSLQESNLAVLNLSSHEIKNHEIKKTENSQPFDGNKQVFEAEVKSFILELLDPELLLGDKQSLYSGNYFDYKKSEDERKFQKKQYEAFKLKLMENMNSGWSSSNMGADSNLASGTKSNTGSALWSLLEPLKNDIQLSANMLEVLNSAKNIKELLMVNSGVSYESSSTEVQHIIDKQLDQQKKQADSKETTVKNKAYSEGRHGVSLLRDFMGKMQDFLFYIIVPGSLWLLILWLKKKKKKTKTKKKSRKRKFRRPVEKPLSQTTNLKVGKRKRSRRPRRHSRYKSDQMKSNSLHRYQRKAS